MKVSLIRHGVATYKDTEKTRDRDNAKDLDPLKIFSLQTQAAEFVNRLDPNDSVTIWSSPIPRSLETSKVFEEAIVGAGISIRKIGIFDVFEEARGFKWEYLSGLVHGTPVMIDGVSVPVDQQITNPESTSVSEYFQTSPWSKFTPETLEALGTFGPIVQAMEPYETIVNRISRSLKKLKKISNKQHHLLIFTHQCCTDFVIEAVNDYKHGGIQPGEAVSLMIQGERIFIEDTPFGNAGYTEILANQVKEKTSETLDSTSA